MNRPARHSGTLLFATAAIAYLLDRVTKIWAERGLADGPIDVIPGVLRLSFTTNPGGAFSLGTSAPWFFAGATIVVGTLIVVTAFRARPRLQAIALGLVLGGALGNLTDRIVRAPGLRGEVVDFIDLRIWPVFNLADSAVVIGAILLAFSAWRSGRPEPEVTVDDH